MAVLDAERIRGIPPSARVLELGCGQIRRVPHSVTIDINPRSIADVVHDLNVTPYPFASDEFDVVIAEHVLEHLNDLVPVVEELHRILKRGGMLYVEVPHFSSCNHFTARFQQQEL
jgi:predicted SAM-dependent methyltransferase